MSSFCIRHFLPSEGIRMIQNLNKLSFQDFGTVAPEVPDQTDWALPWTSLYLQSGAAPAFRATADTWVSCDVGMAVISVSADEVSTSYLTALFHKNLQISPGEYIRRSKLQESKQMIREGNMNFTEIAQTLQYSTIHHFSRQFKEKFGVTPSQYAKSIR